MLRGTPAIAATALAGTPFAMNAMPGPEPMPTSMLSAVSACCIRASPPNADASISTPCLAKMPICMPTSSGVKVQANGTALPTRSFSAALAGTASEITASAATNGKPARKTRSITSSQMAGLHLGLNEIIAEILHPDHAPNQRLR